MNIQHRTKKTSDTEQLAPGCGKFNSYLARKVSLGLSRCNNIVDVYNAERKRHAMHENI